MNFFSVNSFLSKWSCQELDRPGQSGGQLSGCGCYGCVRAWWALQLAHQKLSVYYIRAKEGCKKVGHCTTILTPYVLVHAKAAGWYICRLEGECKGPCVQFCLAFQKRFGSHTAWTGTVGFQQTRPKTKQEYLYYQWSV